MELHYRGAAYDAPDTGVEFTEGDIIGQYRGATLKAHRLSNPPTENAKPRMKYRGAWIQ